MRESWFRFSSIPPKPSVSMTMMCMFSFVKLGIVFFHSHRPFVQGLTVGPTWNPPFFWSRRTLFTKKLLPVRYLPTILMIPKDFSEGRSSRNSYASLERVNPTPSWKVMKGTASEDFVFELFIDYIRSKRSTLTYLPE